MSSSLELGADTSEKRKKVGKRQREGPWHQTHSVAISTSVGDDTRPTARQRTQYVPPVVSPASPPAEDTDTLARAAQLDGFTYLLGDDVHQGLDDFDGAQNVTVEVRNLPKVYDSTRNPMKVWRTYRQDVFEHLLRLDGSGKTAGKPCPSCKNTTKVAQFRCNDGDCMGLGVVCADCIRDAHKCSPLHWVEQWNGVYFKNVSLTDLGVEITLGHKSGGLCPCRVHFVTDFTVLHINGVHVVDVAFCGCMDSEPEQRNQMISDSWWPATPENPKTALTFSLLRFAHALNCNGRVPTWDIWRSLYELTEQYGGSPPPDRYRVLLRCLRQWRHLQMCKQAGQGFGQSGIAGICDGQLATLCPACPQPGKNIPNDFQARSNAWIYTTFLANDANFRLRNENVSTPYRDPPLADGNAYFVKRQPYEHWIDQNAMQDDMPTCSGFAAVHLANIKNAKGLRVSGVTGVCCARHGCLRPNGLGDLRKGEKFCAVDYVHASACKYDPETKKMTSYDIVCIWSINWLKRVKDLPAPVQLLNPETMRFAIPKFHIWAHILKDHAKYSFNFLPFVGMTAAEIIEALWSQSNRAASQTKKMGPGARADTLDDVFNNINRRTIEAFERVLAARLIDAIKSADQHSTDFKNFDAGLESLLTREVLDDWLRQVTIWESDFAQPCPYEPKLQTKLTVAQIQLALERDEQAELARSSESVVQESSASSLLVLGLEIENLQRSLAWEVKARTSGATYQQLNIEKQRTAILRNIRKFRGLQQVYMPHLREYLSPSEVIRLDSPPDVVVPEEIKLYMPSELNQDHRKLPRACRPGLAEMEIRLREAECWEALNDLRSALRTRSAGLLFQVQNVSGQTSVTRAEAIQSRVLINVHLAKLRYRWARNAYYRLRGHGEWENKLRILEDSHVTGLNERMLTAREQEEAADIHERGLIYLGDTGPSSVDAVVSPGEGRRQISWIWYSYPSDVDASTQMDSEAFNEVLKIEWCKARARMQRWREEVELVVEEMRRVVAFNRWRSVWWTSRAEGQAGRDTTLVEGIQALAMTSAERCTDTASRLEAAWAPLVAIAKDLLEYLPITRVLTFEIDADDFVEHDEDDSIVDP